MKKSETTRPHPEGDAPRDEHGKRLDRGADQEAQARPQPAIPEAPKPEPEQAPSRKSRGAE